MCICGLNKIASSVGLDNSAEVVADDIEDIDPERDGASIEIEYPYVYAGVGLGWKLVGFEWSGRPMERLDDGLVGKVKASKFTVPAALIWGVCVLPSYVLC